MSCSISFLLGAGFSAPFNVPTMKPFLSSFVSFSKRRYPLLSATLSQHLCKLDDDSDIENLLSSLDMAARLTFALPEKDEKIHDYHDWIEHSKSLKAHLVSYIIETCEQFDRASSETAISPLLRKISECDKLSVVYFFTTNYDRILEYVLECEDIEFDDGFDDSNNDVAATWNQEFVHKFRLHKLHGSVTYYIDQKAPSDQQYLRLDRGYPLPGPDFTLNREGRQLRPLMVLPDLDKDALGDPYGYFNHVLADILSQGGLLIAIGTSLRDSHLVSALNYVASKIVVLVIDTNPQVAIGRIPNVACIGLEVSTFDFLSNLTGSLINLTEICSLLSSKTDIENEVGKFVIEAERTLSELKELTAYHKDQVNILQTTSSDTMKLEAISKLHGLDEDVVIDAVIGSLNADCSIELRKAVAGFLGLSKSSRSLDILVGRLVNDASPDVRLEACLALRKIGNDEAIKALDEVRNEFPEDNIHNLF